ncbi:MAG: glycosyltransferase family 39 protein [Leptolyngbyaceae cyanobacterium bins.302]|nr:glycosyltransferase family 39 protein [Leptolyngbyaceae cyanobacterium bins.302]
MPVLRSPILKAILPTLIILGLLRLVFWLNTFPNPDEAYYWLWGQHPAFSYYDHPPFQAWVQGVVTSVLGKSFFSLRLSNLFSTCILFYTYFQISKYLYGKNGIDSFWMTIALLLTSPLYFLFLALAWQDHWLITFSLISAFQLIQFLDGYIIDDKGDSRRLYEAAIALGFALLCKYNAVFIGLGFLAAMVSNEPWRKLFRDRRFYFAISIVLAFLLPILIWNLTNDFQSFRYYSDRSVDNAGFQLKFDQALGFVALSILMLSPVNSWAMFHVLRQSRTSTYPTVAFWIFTVSTVSLLAVSLVSTALYYWNILAYLLLFPLLPSVLAPSRTGSQLHLAERSRQSSTPNPHSPLLIVGQGYGILFALLLVIHYSILPLSAFGSGESDPDSRMLFGWEPVGEAVQQQAKTLNQPFFVTSDYRSASALAYQLNNPDVLAISDRIDQFDFWFDATLLKGRDAVILVDDWHPLQPKLKAQFDRLSAPEKISIQRFGIWIKNYYLLRGYIFRPTS